MPRSSLGRRRVAAVVCILSGMLLLPAAPALACTRVGGFTFGECGPAEQPKTSGPRPTPEQVLLELLNEDRVGEGLRQLWAQSSAQAMAEEHAQRMADAGEIFHNPRLKTDTGRRRLGYPARVGENVGIGPNTKSVHTAFMRSPKHQRNVLDPGFRAAGIGAVRKGDSLYVVEIYLTPGGSSGAWGPTVARSEASPQRRAATASRRHTAARPEVPTGDQPELGTYFGREAGAAAGGGSGLGGFAVIGLSLLLVAQGVAQARRRRGQRVRTNAYDLFPERSTMTVSDARSAVSRIDSGLSMRRLLT